MTELKEQKRSRRIAMTDEERDALGRWVSGGK